MKDEGDYIDYGETIRLAPPADILKALAYKDGDMPEGLTSAAQIFFLKARALYRSPVSPEQGRSEMKELEYQYINDRVKENEMLLYSRLWVRIEIPALIYATEPSVENADKFYAAVYNMPDDWRAKRK